MRLMGVGIVPKAYDPLIDVMHLPGLHAHFARLGETVARAVAAMPDHAEYSGRRPPRRTCPDR